LLVGGAVTKKQCGLAETDEGAGVIGLTTALTLAPCKRWKITVVAKHMPGDYDIEYTSAWAGANYLPYVQNSFRGFSCILSLLCQFQQHPVF
jgi:hypothetical protein